MNFFTIVLYLIIEFYVTIFWSFFIIFDIYILCISYLSCIFLNVYSWENLYNNTLSKIRKRHGF